MIEFYERLPDGLTIRDLYVDAPDPLCPLNGVRRYW
jgi:hypothetical protein